jgi:hypothetical protein
MLLRLVRSFLVVILDLSSPWSRLPLLLLPLLLLPLLLLLLLLPLLLQHIPPLLVQLLPHIPPLLFQLVPVMLVLLLQRAPLCPGRCCCAQTKDTQAHCGYRHELSHQSLPSV